MSLWNVVITSETNFLVIRKQRAVNKALCFTLHKDVRNQQVEFVIDTRQPLIKKTGQSKQTLEELDYGIN